jgi:hypothetical protein
VTGIPPAISALLEGKNHELRQHHYDARVGNYQGSRVQAVRDALDGWNPEPGTPLHALWTQVKQATELHTAEIDNIRQEASRDIPGISETQ